MKAILNVIIALLLAMVVLVGCEGEVTPIEGEVNESREEVATEGEGKEDEEDAEDPEKSVESESNENKDNSRTSPAGVGEVFLVEKDDW